LAAEVKTSTTDLHLLRHNTTKHSIATIQTNKTHNHLGEVVKEKG